MSKLYFRGDSIFLYTQFTDQNGVSCQATNPQTRILHDRNGKIYPDLDWTDMQQMSVNEYFYNFIIPFKADLGQYQAIYKGNVNGNDAYVGEVFHVISKSDAYENTVKIYGYIRDIRSDTSLSDVTIKVINSETGESVAQSLSDLDGYWEAFVYPGIYTFEFSKIDFQDTNINVEIGDEHTEMQFNNISLESVSASQKGNGIFEIYDEYVTKQGTPLVGLTVTIASASNPMTTIAQATTDNNGHWECWIDPGIYIMKASGISLGNDFNKIFRIKVDDNGAFTFEDLSKNIAVVSQTNLIGNGNGMKELSDFIKDRHGNPIVDVQVNAFNQGLPIIDSNIIAQDYTDVTGKWTLMLDPGNYVIEYYHPDFKTATENKTI